LFSNIKHAEIELVNLSDEYLFHLKAMSEFSFSSTLPRHKINSACSGMSYPAANSRLAKKLDNKKKTIKMIQNQQPGGDFRKPITELQKELDDIRKKYSDLEIIHKYTSEETASDSKRIWELLYRPIPSIQHLQDLERSLYEANKLVEKQQQEIRTLMNHVKLLEEERINKVSVDDLRRLQQAFTLDS